MEATFSSETSVTTFKTTGRHNPDVINQGGGPELDPTADHQVLYTSGKTVGRAKSLPLATNCCT
jgi:hypothetical protein